MGVSGGGFDNNDTTLQGGTDSTVIGNVGDRLKVTASTDPSPTTNVIYKDIYLLNGATSNMNVNGSVSNVSYDFTPAASETWYLESLTMLIADPGTPDINEFAAIGSALTNGLQLLVRSNGTEYEFHNFKNNGDISIYFSSHSNRDGALGWLNEVDMFIGQKKFNNPIILQNSTSDYIRSKVRDNLTGVSYLYVMASIFRTI